MKFPRINYSDSWLWCEGKYHIDTKFNIVNIYGPHNLEEKIPFQEDLSRIIQVTDIEPLCLMRDFNNIRFKKDREGCIYNQRDTCFFNSLIEDHGLLRLQDDYHFTWFGPKQKKSKLDRVLVNDLWLRLNNWKVTGSHRRKSDRIPLTLSGETVD